MVAKDRTAVCFPKDTLTMTFAYILNRTYLQLCFHTPHHCSNPVHPTPITPSWGSAIFLLSQTRNPGAPSQMTSDYPPSSCLPVLVARLVLHPPLSPVPIRSSPATVLALNTPHPDITLLPEFSCPKMPHTSLIKATSHYTHTEGHSPKVPV